MTWVDFREFAILGLTLASVLFAADRPQRRASLDRPHTNDDAPEAASPPIIRPTMGYVVQRAPLELRAIEGVPGAAVFSIPLPLPRDVTRVSLAPAQSFALVDRRDGSLAMLPLYPDRVAAPVQITGGLAGADLVVFSPLAKSVVLYSNSEARAQVISGLPDTPLIGLDIDTRGIGETIVTAAVSDNATAVLLSSQQVVYQFRPDRSPTQIMNVNGPVELAFFPASLHAALGDSTTGTVYDWPDPGAAAVRPVTAGLLGMEHIRAAADGRHLWVSNPDGQSLWRLDVLTGQLQRFALDIAPSQMEPLAYSGAFLIRSDPGEPAWVLSTRGDDVVTTLVPAVRNSHRYQRKHVVQQ